MAHASLSAVIRHCDRLLHTGDVQDFPGAVNGLQVENRGRVTRVAAAVDATMATVRRAVALRADLLVVHHGLFWGARHPWTDRTYRLLQVLLENNLAVYSSHLPLDLHPRLGNNARLATALGLRALKPFFESHGQKIGFQAVASLSRRSLSIRLHQATGHEPLVIPGGPDTCHRIGIVTGGAGAELKIAADEGVDTFVTGEGPHWTFALAEELGLNVLYGGHYATETFGVKALAAELARKFKVPWTFIDYPTGL